MRKANHLNSMKQLHTLFAKFIHRDSEKCLYLKSSVWVASWRCIFVAVFASLLVLQKVHRLPVCGGEQIPKAAVLGPVWGIPPRERRGKVTSPGGFPTGTSRCVFGGRPGSGLWQSSVSAPVLVAGQSIAVSILTWNHSCGSSCSSAPFQLHMLWRAFSLGAQREQRSKTARTVFNTGAVKLTRYY